MATHEDWIEALAIGNYQGGFGNRGPLLMNTTGLMDSWEKDDLQRSIKEATVANGGEKLKPGDFVEYSTKDPNDTSSEGEKVRYYHLPRIETSPLLCTVCQNLVQGEWYEKFEHHGSLSALKRSSLSCHMCFLAYHKLDEIAIEMIRGAAKILKTDVRFQIPDAKLDVVWGERRPREHPGEFKGAQTFYPSEIVFSLRSKDAAQRNSDMGDLGQKIALYPEATFNVGQLSDDMARVLEEYPMALHPDTTISLQIGLALEWLRRCRESHFACRSLAKDKAALPSRILDISPEGPMSDPVLVECSSTRDDYVTLSHRWGGSKVITTTTATLSIRKAGIPVAEMPKTFRDAIKITRALGFRYLWIDSLCIIQDDLEDWEAEAEKMGQIYQKSSLTIFAVMATSADTGCFPDSPRSGYDGIHWPCFIGTLHCNLEQTWHPSHSDKLYIFSKQEPERSRQDSMRPRGPLDSRGWVLQEESFSSCRLSFCHQGVFWECLEMDASEAYPDGLNAGNIAPSMYALNFKQRLLEPQRRRNHFQNYMQSQPPTCESERIVAIDTIRKILATMNDSDYLTKYWEKKLSGLRMTDEQLDRIANTSELFDKYLQREPLSETERQNNIDKLGQASARISDDFFFLSPFIRETRHRQPKPYQIWYQLVENYTQRELTQESDRLIAIDGLAQAMANMTGDIYLVGLWMKPLLAQLLWHVDTGVVQVEWDSYTDLYQRPRQLSPMLRPPKRVRRTIVAPSWTWATVSYGVSWRHMHTGVARPLVDVAAVDVNKVRHGVFTGRIKLRGVLRSAKAVPGDSRNPDVLMDPSNNENLSKWYYCDDIEWTDDRVMCLGLVEMGMSLPQYGINNEDQDVVHCLVLFPTENCFLANPASKVAEFRRAGVATWAKDSWNKLGSGSKGVGNKGNSAATTVYII